MKLKPYALCALMLITIQSPWAQTQPSDVLVENLFPPELVMNYQADIGLSDQQRDSIVADIKKAQSRFEAMHQDLRKEFEKMGDLLKKERIEDQSALSQFEKVLNLERDLKRAHLALAVGIKNKLTPDQQTKLQKIKQQHASGKPPLSLQSKMEAKIEKVKAGVEKWQNDGRDPSPIAEMMQEFEPLMKAGKWREADAILDKALKLLGESK